MTGERGPGFTLTLTKFAAIADIETVKNSIIASKGQLVRIIQYYDGSAVDYYGATHGGLLFLVTQARPIESAIIPRACGYRLGVGYDFAPAAKVVSQWTMYAVRHGL